MVPEFLVSLAANLAFTLMQKGGGRLRALLFGTAEQKALQTAWQTAFTHMLVETAPRLARQPGDYDELLTRHVADVFEMFVQNEEAATMLLDVALAGRTPPLEKLRDRFDQLEFDRKTIPVKFRPAMRALTAGLTQALLEAAAEANSPLHNRVNIVRLAATQQLLEQQQVTLEQMAERLAQLDAELRRNGRDSYTVNFLGPVAGLAVGDGAMAQVDAGVRPLLEQVLAQLNRLVIPPPTAPYTEADKAAYLEAVIEECRMIRLPYIVESGRATIPLREIYVALKADRSSPVERQASYQLFQNLVREASPDGRDLDDDLVARLAALDPYAGRYRIYDSQLREQLLAARQEEGEKSYDLAEILRQHRWLVLLGDPGSGKSTLARWLALHLALAVKSGAEAVTVPADHVRPDGEAAQLESLGATRLPVLVRLADYAAARWLTPDSDTRLPLRLYLGKHIEGLLEPGGDQRAIYNLIKDYLAGGRVTFILDGLDEVTNLDQRHTIAGEIEKLIADWIVEEDGQTPLTAAHHRRLASASVSRMGNQIIVTSRIVGYQLRPLHPNLPHFVIQPMGDEAVTRFCHNWTAATGIAEKAEALTEGVLKHPNPHVRQQMARNPLLLTILAQVFSRQPDAGLPARRTELYHQAQMAVFKQRQTGQWPLLNEQLPGDDLPRVLSRLTARVAYELHANPDYPNALADERALARWLAAAVAEEPALQSRRRTEDVVAELLKAAAQLSGFLVARGERVYGFLHRQFQEYFAAVYLVRQMQKGSDETRWQPVLSRLVDPNWHEVILLAVGILEQEADEDAAAFLTAIVDAPDPTEGVLPHNALLVEAALQEMKQPPDRVVEQVATALIDAYRRDNEARFVFLKKSIAAAFTRLPRPQGQRDPVDRALCRALRAAKGDDDSGRFQRLAALELILEAKWYTAAVTRALLQTWRSYSEPAATMLLTLERIYAAHPDNFRLRSHPLRQQWAQGWAAAVSDEAWAAVVRALYLTSAVPAMTAAAIIRDSPLTDGLRQLLTPPPADRNQLLTWLRQQLQEGTGPAQRDAGLALWYLGDSAALLPYLMANDEGTAIFRRSLVALASRALDRDLDRDLALALDRALDLDLDRALALDLALDLALALDRALDLDLDLARDRDLALDLARAIDLDLARAIDLDLARAIARDLARARTLSRLLTNMAEIGGILEKALTHPDISSELRDDLQISQQRFNELQRFLTERTGFWQVWQVWDEQAAQPATVGWSRKGRTRLSIAGLKELGAHLAAGATLHPLPRLDARSLADLYGPDKAEAITLLTDYWQAATETTRPQIALLLAEMKIIRPETLPWLLPNLTSANDLTRYRTQIAIKPAFQQPASVLGRELIEALSRYQTENAPFLMSTYQGWALNEIRHDQPDWLQEWLAAGETTILGRIHYLDKESWPVLLAGLGAADTAVRLQLLEAIGWLLRLDNKNIPIAELQVALFDLCHTEDDRPQAAALTAIGHWRQEPETVLRPLLALDKAWSAGSLPAYLTAVARLTAQTQDADLTTQAEAVLRSHLPQPAATAALTRLLVMRQGKKVTLTTLLAFLNDKEAALPAAELLFALLQAGTDDDEWDSYHETIAQLIREWVEREAGLLDRLLTALQAALDGNSWSESRIALAATAACAERMPDALNTVWEAAELTDLLITGTQDAGSHNSRRYGILALSHLRVLTPSILEALLAAAHDVSDVQRDAVQAAGNFRRLHPHFSDETALSSLTVALNGESGAAAYLSARVLAALGSSPAVAKIPGLRARIAQALSEASQNERAQEMVYLLEDQEIKEVGTRAQVILGALSQVWALPGR
jgi:hypothetical protein